MISRYSTPGINHVWSDLNKFNHCLEIERLAIQEWARLGVIPEQDAKLIDERAAFTLEKINEYEKKTRHDFAAFVDVVADSIGEEGRWIHYGLTSSDVIDTALSLQMRDALNLISNSLEQLINQVWRMKTSYESTLMIGRTHGVHAEPITLGHKFKLWALELERNQIRLINARENIEVGSISGTVGTYATVDPRVEEGICLNLGLKPEPSKQIISRDRHAEFVWVLASIATALDSIATELRLLAQTEIGEVQEVFVDGQKGSSAMPHKQNPVRCERICGLARIVRGYVATALENNVTWHERDISNSSVERLMLPDSSALVHFMLIEMYDILSRLNVNEDKMSQNMDLTHGIIYSHRVMLALIRAGLSRKIAYDIIQKTTKNSRENRRSFRDFVLNNKEITDVLSYEDINKCFEPKLQYGFAEYDRLMPEEVR